MKKLAYLILLLAVPALLIVGCPSDPVVHDDEDNDDIPAGTVEIISFSNIDIVMHYVP